MTNPPQNAVFSAPASIPFAATANDPDGIIVRVEYRLGNTVVGDATTPPFDFNWTNVPPGTYVLRAVATDAGGLSVTSAVRRVFVESASFTLIAAGATWKYFDVNGTNLGTAWRATNYNDSAWPSGAAKLGFGGSGIVTAVNPTQQRITTYFRRSFVVTNPASITNLTYGLLRDDGAVVYLNSNEVFRSNMPGGIISNSTLASSAISGAEETTWFTNKVANPVLQLGTNTIGVEVHQGSTNSSDLGFNFLLAAQAGAPPLVPMPMAIARSGSDLGFAWPANSGWNLYSTPAMATTALWTRVTSGLQSSNGEMRIMVSPAEGARYFQLRQP